MGSNHSPVEVDPLAVRHSQKLWANFTFAAKYGVIGAAVILLLMALFLVN